MSEHVPSGSGGAAERPSRAAIIVEMQKEIDRLSQTSGNERYLENIQLALSALLSIDAMQEANRKLFDPAERRKADHAEKVQEVHRAIDALRSSHLLKCQRYRVACALRTVLREDRASMKVA